MGHFEMQNGPFWKSALFLLLSCTTFLPKKNESGSEKSKKILRNFSVIFLHKHGFSVTRPYREGNSTACPLVMPKGRPSAVGHW